MYNIVIMIHYSCVTRCIFQKLSYITKNRVTRGHQHGGDCSDGLDQGLRREEPGADFVDRRSEGNHSLEQPKSSCRWGGGGMIAFSVAFLTLNYIRRRISDLLNTHMLLKTFGASDSIIAHIQYGVHSLCNC